MPDNKSTYPLLQALINSGDITWLGSDLIGHASDGTVVSLGTEYDPDAIERYLREHPTPADW